LGTEPLFGLGLVTERAPRLVIKLRKLLILIPTVKKRKAADKTSSRAAVRSEARSFKWAGGGDWEGRKANH